MSASQMEFSTVVSTILAVPWWQLLVLGFFCSLPALVVRDVFEVVIAPCCEEIARVMKKAISFKRERDVQQ